MLELGLNARHELLSELLLHDAQRRRSDAGSVILFTILPMKYALPVAVIDHQRRKRLGSRTRRPVQGSLVIDLILLSVDLSPENELSDLVMLILLRLEATFQATVFFHMLEQSIF